MDILEEIRDGFASMREQGALKILSISKEYPSYIIRLLDGYGVAIPIDDKTVVAENFNSCKFRTGLLSIEGVSSNYLMLISAFEEYRYEFASLCAELIAPGYNGDNRKELLQNPLNWWEKWKDLVGNSFKDREIYSIIAEMQVIEHKMKTDSTVQWTATRMGSHDVECATESCEVKSTKKRYGAEITISGQHQLMHDKDLTLYFLRMEESQDGVSINDMKERLIMSGYESGRIEQELQQFGLEKGASIRDRKYKTLEKRKYDVDEKFPRITNESFKDNRIPLGITQIIYTVDLDSIDYTTW